LAAFALAEGFLARRHVLTEHLKLFGTEFGQRCERLSKSSFLFERLTH
jgi:hypothetical protein